MVEKYSLRLLKMGEHVVPGTEVFFMKEFDKWMKLYFYMVVARSKKRTVVLNTGLPTDISYMAKFWSSIDKRVTVKRTENEMAANALKQIGLKPEEVEMVVLTPITSYTTGNLDLFTKAKICMLRRGWVDFISPRPPDVLPRQAVFPDHVLKSLVTDWWERVILLEDHDNVADGIETYYTGGHHSSSMLVIFDTEIGKVGFTDSFFTLRNLEEEIPIGIAENLKEAHNAIKFAKEKCDIVIPLYDPILLKKYPNGIICK